MEIKQIDTRHGLYEAELDLRYRVLRAPLGMSRASTLFEFEAQSWHWVALDGGQVVGCVLFHPQDAHQGRLFQMAVAPDRQGTGVGRQLVSQLERDVAPRGITTIILHARDTAIGFYERLGYTIYGQPYLEVGIPHRHMRRRLVATTP